MNCDEARRRWHDRFDRTLDDPDLEKHLESCEACRRYAEEMDRVAGLLDKLRVDSEGVISHRHNGVDDNSRAAGRNVLLWPGRLLGVAAIVFIAVTAGLYFRTDPATVPVGGNTDNVVSAGLGAPVRFELTGKSADEYLAVQRPGVADEPVEVVWLYPTRASRQDEDES